MNVCVTNNSKYANSMVLGYIVEHIFDRGWPTKLYITQKRTCHGPSIERVYLVIATDLVGISAANVNYGKQCDALGNIYEAIVG